MAGFLSKVRLKASELTEQAVSFLVAKYEQAANVFTPASPFGQLLIVISNISELIFTYIAHAAEELNINTAQNVESIYGLSRLTGHDAYRGGSAFGSMEAKLNTSAADIIDGECVIINNFTKFQIPETGCTYFLNLQSDNVKLSVSEANYINLPFVEGKIETQTFTSDGSPLQSFNPIIKGMTDNDNVAVTVNGREWTKVDSLYDMPAEDGTDSGNCFMVKSSVNVGLTIFFGNGNFGNIPPAGSIIEVTYIITEGLKGNANSSNLTYVFIDPGYDQYGGEVDLNEVLTINTKRIPLMGSNFEDPEFTKLIAPRTSKSFVLATPENYISYLSRYNQFSFINAFNTKEDDNLYDDNVVYLKLIPNIKKKLSSNHDYFEIPESEFVLSNEEKDAIYGSLEDSGRMLVNSEVEIIDPVIKRFSINVIVRYFENADKNTIREDIRNRFNTYFLNINRNDIIPLSDMISLVEAIDGVDTCDIFFVTEENESAVINGSYVKKSSVWNTQTLSYITEETVVDLEEGEDPQIGLDSFGNIVLDDDYSIYIPRGGWKDRNGNYYTETPETGKLGPLNIFFLDKVDTNMYNQLMQRRLNNLLKDNL